VALTGAGSAPGIAGSPHLTDLLAEADHLAPSVASAPPEARGPLAAAVGREACRATLALEGADPTQLPTPEQARATVAAAVHGDEPADLEARPGTWLDALGFATDLRDELIQAHEVLGVVAASGADDLTEGLLTDPLPALAELHGRLTAGLVAAGSAGVPRRTDQAVHDASIGRVIYVPSDPSAIPEDLARLAEWLVAAAPHEHGVVLSGVLHHELLRIHPYEAANGRLARAAARLVLRGRGLDPDGLAAPELALARDPLGYHSEVASSLRRRDLTMWLERWGEAVTDGLRAAARTLGVLALEPPARARSFLEQLTGPSFTIVDYRSATATSMQDTLDDLRSLLDHDLARRVPGSRGLRFVVDERPHQMTGGTPAAP
jgi:fido (protein-threonine AMPylation protein)